jgi:hypothetical protein
MQHARFKPHAVERTYSHSQRPSRRGSSKLVTLRSKGGWKPWRGYTNGHR